MIEIRVACLGRSVTVMVPLSMIEDGPAIAGEMQNLAARVTDEGGRTMKVRMTLTLDVDEEQWRAAVSEDDLKPLDTEVRAYVDGYLATMPSMAGALRGFEIEPA